MLLKKLVPVLLLAAGLTMAATIPLLGGKAKSSSEMASPEVMVTHLEMEYLFTSSARFLLELNVHNPNNVPAAMDISLEIQARNSPGDEQFISLGEIATDDLQPISWFWEFRRTEGGLIMLYPLRYHPLRFRGILETVVPPELRPDGRGELFPYLYDNGQRLGFQGPVGQVEMRVVGQARFSMGDSTVVIPVEESIRVPFPYRY
jgi:hypothetical protein